jgi:hypothetical protein
VSASTDTGATSDRVDDLGGEVVLGSMLFTLVEPHKGHEVAYHRWYERDHFYAGCMVGPWFFAGRRWVSTRDLKDMRIGGSGEAPPLFGDDAAGSYLALYWVLDGRGPENTDWGSRQVKWLHDNGRMFPHRDHIHTLIYRYRGAERRDDDGVPAELALDHPFRGLAAVVVERPPDAEPKAPVPQWDLAPDSSVALVLRWSGIPLPPGAPVTQPGTEGTGRREMQLWFADSEPEHWWPAVEAYAEGLKANGEGVVRWASPFVPTVPGTDRYTDRLW